MADVAPCTPWGGIFHTESMSSTVLLVTNHSCDGLIPDRLDFRRRPCWGRPTVDPSSGSLPGVLWADCRNGPRHRERVLQWASSCAGQKPAWSFSSGPMDIVPGITRPSGTKGPQKSPPMRAGSESRRPRCWTWITADRWGRRCYGLATTSGPLCRLSEPSRCWHSGPRCCRPSTS